MDYFIGFLIGYYWFKVTQYIKDLATIETFEIMDHEWDGYFTDDE
jgi:hypothetical protein